MFLDYKPTTLKGKVRDFINKRLKGKKAEVDDSDLHVCSECNSLGVVGDDTLLDYCIECGSTDIKVVGYYEYFSR